MEDSQSGVVFYEQLVTVTGCHKLGDSVYVLNPQGGTPLIARVDKICKDLRYCVTIHASLLPVSPVTSHVFISWIADS